MKNPKDKTPRPPYIISAKELKDQKDYNKKLEDYLPYKIESTNPNEKTIHLSEGAKMILDMVNKKRAN
tara:strand:+ start:285 stop:488 length:204 start_codon:yes stop_codon:yes gene_type:complete